MLMNFIHVTTVIMMIFSRAGHEGDRALHLYATEAMLPFYVHLVSITMHVMLHTMFFR